MTMVVKNLSDLIKSIEAFEPVTVLFFSFSFLTANTHSYLTTSGRVNCLELEQKTG